MPVAMSIVITVGIPAYETWGKLHRLLASLQTQTTPLRFEVIVGDDAYPSAPLATRVREHFPDFKSFRNPINGGAAYTRNRILERARGKYVAFLDADCIAPPNWLERVEPFLQSEVLLSGTVFRPDGSLEWGPRYRTWLGVSRACANENANVASSNNLVVPLKLAYRIGGFNEALGIYFEDSLFSMQAILCGAQVRHIGDIIVKHDHFSGLSANRLQKQARNTLYSMHHYYATRPLVQQVCFLGLSMHYALQALLHAAHGRPRDAAALLSGIRNALDMIRTVPWKTNWLRETNLPPRSSCLR